MWMRWNDSTHIFEQSFNDGASWAVLPLNASVINEGAINIARLPANIAVKDANNNFSVGQTITGGLTVTSGGFGVTGGAVVQTGGIAVNGNSTVNGTLAVNGSQMQVTLGGGTAVIGVQNSSAGIANTSRVRIGNDVNIGLLDIACYSSNYAPSGSGFDVPNGTVLYQGGAGGLSLVTGAVGAPIRFFTGIERMRLLSSGELCLNTVGSIFGGLISLFTDVPSRPGIVLQNSSVSNSGNLQLYLNSAGVVAGNIAQSGATTVFYGTTSDQRLKNDIGRAKDLASLRSLIVHDFTWKADDTRDRGIFAQEAHKLYPRAIMKGTNELLDDGNLKHPWMIDSSKFVYDLIVGWQEHDREITELKTEISELEAKLNA